MQKRWGVPMVGVLIAACSWAALAETESPVPPIDSLDNASLATPSPIAPLQSLAPLINPPPAPPDAPNPVLGKPVSEWTAEEIWAEVKTRDQANKLFQSYIDGINERIATMEAELKKLNDDLAAATTDEARDLCRTLIASKQKMLDAQRTEKAANLKAIDDNNKIIQMLVNLPHVRPPLVGPSEP